MTLPFIPFECLPESLHNSRIGFVSRHGLLIFRHCFLRHSLMAIRIAEVLMRRAPTRVYQLRLTVRLYGLRILAGSHVVETQVIEGSRRNRIQANIEIAFV